MTNSTYEVGSAERLALIKMYHEGKSAVYLMGGAGGQVEEIETTWENISWQGDKFSIKCITTRSQHFFKGFWPVFANRESMTIASNHENDFLQMIGYIDGIVEQHKGAIVYDYGITPPDPENQDLDIVEMFLAITVKRPVAGAVLLNSPARMIVFEVKGQQFVLAYSETSLKIKHLSDSFSFDLDDGFMDYGNRHPNLKVALNVHFNAWKNNNYQGEVIEDGGFSAVSCKEYSDGILIEPDKKDKTFIESIKVSLIELIEPGQQDKTFAESISDFFSPVKNNPAMLMPLLALVPPFLIAVTATVFGALAMASVISFTAPGLLIGLGIIGMATTLYAGFAQINNPEVEVLSSAPEIKYSLLG